MHNIFLALALVGALASRTLYAQAAASPPRDALRLGDLYREAQRDNPRVAADNALARAARARISGVGRPADPQVQLAAMNYALPALVPMRPLGMLQLQIMQMVPLGPKLSLATRVAEAEASATQSRAHEGRWELRSQLAMAFYELYEVDAQLALMRESLRLLRDIEATAASMYRVGEGRQADVLRAQVETARMAADTLRMHARRQSLAARLNVLRGAESDAVLGTPTLPPFPDVLPERAWLDTVALGGRHMLRAGEASVRAADAASRLARRELIPDLQIGVQFGQQRSAMTATDAMGTARLERRTERMGSLMVGAAIPIFARDRQLQMRAEADAMRSMAQAELAAMRAETRGRIGEILADLTRARTLATLYRTTILPQVASAVTSALASYRAGAVDFMTLLDNRMIANRYQQELYTLEANEGAAWAELEMLIGRELLDADALRLADTRAPEPSMRPNAEKVPGGAE